VSDSDSVQHQRIADLTAHNVNHTGGTLHLRGLSFLSDAPSNTKPVHHHGDISTASPGSECGKVTSSPGYSGITMTKNPAPDHINTYPYRAYFPKHSPLQTDSAPKHTPKPHLSTKPTPTSHSIIIHATKTEVYLRRPSPPAIAFHAPIRVTSKYILHPMHPAPIYANALVPRPILIPSMLSFSTR
jgi:hypothetical protein